MEDTTSILELKSRGWTLGEEVTVESDTVMVSYDTGGWTWSGETTSRIGLA
jgi:hypothetical protein